MKWLYAVAATTFLCLAPQLSFATDSGLITKVSKHSVSETAQKFESAVNDKSANGWLTYNSAEYIQDYVYPRHGLPSNPDAAKATGSVLADFAQKATD